MIKLLDILKIIITEGTTTNTLDINLKRSGELDGPFILNTDKKSRKIKGIETYYGISRNIKSKLNIEETTEIYNELKNTNISPEILSYIILPTAPSIYVKYIMILPSSSELNKSLADILKQKYKVPDENILTNISKIEYFIDDMINKETYTDADPTTQKMADTWIRSLKKHYGTNAPKMPIKKSGNKETGHPGIQTGARHLLNPVYKIEDNWKVNNNILVVDDFLIGGSSIKEIYTQLIDRGIPIKNINGYCLGVKDVILSKTKEKSTKTSSTINDEVKQIEDEIAKIEFDPTYLSWKTKLKEKPHSEFLQNSVKRIQDRLIQLRIDLKDAQERSLIQIKSLKTK
jgi:hypothetical protein